MKIGHVFVTLVLAACGIAVISDRYGNQYGDWYNPGGDYRWQLDACEHQVEAQNIPLAERKLAMRCCMYAHGVPIGDPQDCRT
jgi:hypothetical protein